jgi:hypothetical protein
VTTTISPKGGTVSVDGASLTIPAGALPTAVPISIDKTTIDVPSGYVGYSAVYNFRPGGLVFTKPAKVTMQFAGEQQRAGVYWTMAGMFERLGGTVKGDRITASITHFSSGFVGTGSAPDVGTATPDASTDREPVVDASSDATSTAESGSPGGQDDRDAGM